MQIRYAQSGDLPALRAMWDICFGDPRIWTDWFFKNRVRLCDILCLEENGVVLSSVHMMPRQLLIRGQQIPTGFIVGAATLPEARGKGHMAALLRAAFIEMRKRGDVFSYLYPFNWDFYRKFGYEVMNDVLYCTLPYYAQLPAPETRMTAEKPSDLPLTALWSCYTSFTQHYSGMAVRSRALFSQRIEEHMLEAGEVYTVKHKAAMHGYALCRSLEDRVEVFEAVFRSSDALLSLLRAVLSDADGREVLCTLPTGLEKTAQAWRINYRQDVYGMLRVLDAPRALHLFCPEDSDTVIGIKDADISGNEGCFTCYGVESHDLPAFCVNAAQLGQWLCGYAPLSELAQAQTLPEEGYNAVMALEESLPPEKTFIFEQY